MKRPRISYRSSEGPQVDRISTLPDDTLIHILSFLTTKEAVQTCVLAKRWTNLWASVPVLVLDLDEFRTDGLDGEPETVSGTRKLLRRVDHFVSGFLDNRTPTSLDTVIYLCPFEGRDFGAPTAWLRRACLLKPREIHISITNCTSLILPDSIFSCASLENLEIYLNVRDMSTICPVSINLPALKYLKLRGVQLDNYFTEKLLMGCPSLEFLKLTDCNLYCSSISSNVLKELIIHRCYHHKKMQISCPGLVTLYIASYIRRDISLKSITSLVDAFIALRLWNKKAGNHELSVCDLLGGLTNAKNLVFCVAPWLKEQLKRDIPNCNPFNNLKSLTIFGMSRDFQLVGCLLKHSPKLEVLKLHLHEQNRGDSQEEPRREVLGDVSFQHEYLKSVHIYDFDRYKLLATEVVKMLSVYVKKIGKMVVR